MLKHFHFHTSFSINTGIVGDLWGAGCIINLNLMKDKVMLLPILLKNVLLASLICGCLTGRGVHAAGKGEGYHPLLSCISIMTN